MGGDLNCTESLIVDSRTYTTQSHRSSEKLQKRYPIQLWQIFGNKKKPANVNQQAYHENIELTSCPWTPSEAHKLSQT